MRRQAGGQLHPPLHWAGRTAGTVTGDRDTPEDKVKSATFAANRAHGCVALAVAATPLGVRRTTTREEGSLRVRFPNACAAAPEAVLVNTAGGIAGGDRFA